MGKRWSGGDPELDPVRDAIERDVACGRRAGEIAAAARIADSMVSRLRSGLRDVCGSALIRVLRALGLDVADELAERRCWSFVVLGDDGAPETWPPPTGVRAWWEIPVPTPQKAVLVTVQARSRGVIAPGWPEAESAEPARLPDWPPVWTRQ